MEKIPVTPLRIPYEGICLMFCHDFLRTYDLTNDMRH